MENEEFILEALKRITPDTSWHGETYADNKSIKNIDILEDMIYFLLGELFEYSIVPAGNRGNYSFEAIAKKKQKVFNSIKGNYFETEEELKNDNDNDKEGKQKYIVSLSLFKDGQFMEHEKKEATKAVYNIDNIKWFDDYSIKAKNLVDSGLYDVAVISEFCIDSETLNTVLIAQQVVKK